MLGTKLPLIVLGTALLSTIPTSLVPSDFSITTFRLLPRTVNSRSGTKFCRDWLGTCHCVFRALLCLLPRGQGALKVSRGGPLHPQSRHSPPRRVSQQL